jgi:uncharacterized protein involved in exopolysaccharide biosynthesis
MRDLNQPSLTAMMNNSSSEQELTLAEIRRGIYKHKFVVLCVTVAVFAIVLLYTMLSPRVYESGTTIAITTGMAVYGRL